MLDTLQHNLRRPRRTDQIIDRHLLAVKTTANMSAGHVVAVYRGLKKHLTNSGVETGEGGSGGSMNRGPELLEIAESGAKKITQEKNAPLLKNWKTEVIYLAENTKSIKTLGVVGLHRFPDPVAGPRTLKPHLRSQHVGLPVLVLGGRPRELKAPRLLLNQGPSELC